MELDKLRELAEKNFERGLDTTRKEGPRDSVHDDFLLSIAASLLYLVKAKQSEAKEEVSK